MKRRIVMGFLIFFLTLLILYLFMFFNTNSLMREVRSAFLLELDSIETSERAIDVYNYNWISERGCEVGEMNLTLVRLFTLHNFRRGHVWVVYSYTAHDKTGELLTGSQNVFTKWEIERIDGEWEITKIFERP